MMCFYSVLKIKYFFVSSRLILKRKYCKYFNKTILHVFYENCDLGSSHCGSASMRTRVQSLALLIGLRIQHYRELWCRWKMWLGSCCCCDCGVGQQLSSDLTPSLGTSICCRGGPKKQKQKPKKQQTLPSQLRLGFSTPNHILFPNC